MTNIDPAKVTPSQPVVATVSNTSSKRSWLDILGLLMIGITAILTQFGCVDDPISGQLSCTGADLPTWVAPWSATIAMVFNGWRVIMKMVSPGGLFGKKDAVPVTAVGK